MSHNPKFKKGDRIKCIDNHGCRPRLTIGKIYEALSDTDSGGYVSINDDKLPNEGWYSYRFELVENRRPPTEVTLKGTIRGRAGGVVSLETEHGIVLLPDKMVPDPELDELREIIALYYDSFAKPTAKTTRDGKYDDRMAAALAKYKELTNAKI